MGKKRDTRETVNLRAECYLHKMVTVVGVYLNGQPLHWAGRQTMWEVL